MYERERERERGEREREASCYLKPNSSTEKVVPHIPSSMTGLRPHRSDSQPQKKLPRNEPTKNEGGPENQLFVHRAKKSKKHDCINITATNYSVPHEEREKLCV